MRRLLLIGAALASCFALAQGYAPTGSSSISSNMVLEIVEGEGSLSRADRDTHANTFVASATAPDGGPAEFAYVSTRDAKWKLGGGDQCELDPTGNSLSVTCSDVRLRTAYITQPACTPATNCLWYSDGWFGTYPAGSTPACNGLVEGGLKGNSTDHELYYCNGTSNQAVAFTRRWADDLDFAVFAGVGCQKLTFTATGVARDENVAAGGCGSVLDADTDLLCAVAATDTDEVTVKVCCLDAGGCVDLSPIDFSVAVVR